jgi:hypothetical protein
MIRSILIAVLLLATTCTIAQTRTSSPYSYFGLGQQTFRGTIENRSMAGISTYLDSVHVTIQNPASYGNLRLTNYGLGAVYTATTAKAETIDGEISENSNATTIEYLSLGFPIGTRAGVGFGLVPFKSVGYNLGNTTSNLYTRFRGSGDLTRAYLGAGFKINKQLSMGAEFRYNFGEELNSSSVALSNVQFGTNEVNESDFSGASYNFALHYQKIINSKYEIQASLVYSPESTITSLNNRTLNTFALDSEQNELITGQRTFDQTTEKLRLPSDLTVGFSIGQRLEWAVIGEYSLRGSSVTTARSFAPPNGSTFENAATYRIGGFYIPDYNSITSYWNRATYRGGMRYEQTGLILENESITEFGMSFGMGLPIGTRFGFSNANIGLEFGQRGTTSGGLIKENFFSLSIGLSLNDKWFTPRKYY